MSCAHVYVTVCCIHIYMAYVMYMYGFTWVMCFMCTYVVTKYTVVMHMSSTSYTCMSCLRSVVMSRSLRQPQEPTHEGRGREEEDPRETEVHVNRRANGVNTSSEHVNARIEALEKALCKWFDNQERVMEVFGSLSKRAKARELQELKWNLELEEKLKQTQDESNAWKGRAVVAEREVSRLLAIVAAMGGDTGAAAEGPDRFSMCSAPATPGLAHRFSLPSPAPSLMGSGGFHL